MTDEIKEAAIEYGKTVSNKALGQDAIAMMEMVAPMATTDIEIAQVATLAIMIKVLDKRLNNARN